MSASVIQLRGVEVHNLKRVDLDLPQRRLIAFCGVSGSGKTSLALDTLYAEGQRRYIETFSAHTRQFLQQLEKPAAERIDGIPPAVAVTHKNHVRSNRATVGTATEINDYLQLLISKLGRVICPNCQCPVRRDSPQSAAEQLQRLTEGTRLMVAFPVETPWNSNSESGWAQLRKEGILRAVAGTRMIDLSDPSTETEVPEPPVYAVLDRLTVGKLASGRLRESLEIAAEKGGGQWFVFVQGHCDEGPAAAPAEDAAVAVEGRSWQLRGFSSDLRCGRCGMVFPMPSPRLLNFNSPLGACPHCEGFGNEMDIDMDLVVPDRGKTLRDGAIAPWNSPAYAHELEELLALADDYELPVDVPYRDLTADQVQLIREGVPQRDFGGLRGFFAWLERRKYKMHLRVFLSRWRSYRPCSVCQGDRLRPEALAVRLHGKSIADFSKLRISAALSAFDRLELTPWQAEVGRVMIDQIVSRLRYLCEVGIGYLSLDRTLRTLSRGERQRVMFTSALGSGLVNMMYVLDEPSVGLHCRDVGNVTRVLRQLADRGNTVVVVDHEESILRTADHVVELGPEAGERGGQVVFEGTPQQLESSGNSPTGQWLSGRRSSGQPARRRSAEHGWIRLTAARGNNLKNITVEFPLGVLCVVTGVSGAGKSTLVQETLVPAVARRKRLDGAKPLPHDDVFGDGQFDELVMVDQTPVGRSSRSNPVTYVNAFDQIRAVFADTIEARTHNFGPGHFSFNVDSGRCEHCRGDGRIGIDMQFLADIYVTCPQCHGQRFRPEILSVRYRGRSIAEVLKMTVRSAFSFFRGHPKVQARLQKLIDVGLEYVQLGQPVNTLSAGEAQRLKLAGYLVTTRRGRVLFVLDEPTTGLHFSDVVRLLDCFDSLLDIGHSLIVVEHNLQVIRAADYVIDLGPGAGDDGGAVVAAGTPEQIAGHPHSVTARYL